MSAAELIIDRVMRLLPEHRQAWGVAMRAELAQLESPRERRSFALGCVVAVLRQPSAWASLRYPVLLLALLASGVLWSAQIVYPPLHNAALVMMIVLIGLSWLGRWLPVLGPVRADRAARAVRATGLSLVLVMVCAIFYRFSAGGGNLQEEAGAGVPILTATFVCYLLAFLSVTARGSAAHRHTLIISARAAGVAAAAWTVAALMWAPLPVTSSYALLAVVVAAALAIVWAKGSTAQRWLAALLASTLASLAVFTLVIALLRWPFMVPDIGGPYFHSSITPAQALKANQEYAVDPYLAVLLIGAMLAAALSLVSALTRRLALRAGWVAEQSPSGRATPPRG